MSFEKTTALLASALFVAGCSAESTPPSPPPSPETSATLPGIPQTSIETGARWVHTGIAGCYVDMRHTVGTDIIEDAIGSTQGSVFCAAGTRLMPSGQVSLADNEKFQGLRKEWLALTNGVREKVYAHYTIDELSNLYTSPNFDRVTRIGQMAREGSAGKPEPYMYEGREPFHKFGPSECSLFPDMQPGKAPSFGTQSTTKMMIRTVGQVAYRQSVFDVSVVEGVEGAANESPGACRVDDVVLIERSA